jgi:glycosyltransferase involved in cell wall biosynthesis
MTTSINPGLTVAITTNTLQAGGAEKQRVHLANALSRGGNDVTMFVLQQDGPLASLIDVDVRVVYTSPLTVAPQSSDICLSGTTNTETAFAILQVATRRTQRWCIAIHNPVGVGAPRLGRLALCGLQIADATIALSRRHSEALKNDWGHCASHIIPNAVDLGMADQVQAWRRGRSAASFDYPFGYIGRLSLSHKGLDRLMRLMKAAMNDPLLSVLLGDNWRLAIAGEGPDRHELRDLAEQLGIHGRVDWLGHTTAEEFFQRIHTLMLLSRYEAQPLVLLEAAAAGAPVVASSTAQAEQGPLCSVIDPDDIDASLACLVTALSSGEQDATPASHYSPADMADSHRQLFRDVMAAEPARIATRRLTGTVTGLTDMALASLRR